MHWWDEKRWLNAIRWLAARWRRIQHEYGYRVMLNEELDVTSRHVTGHSYIIIIVIWSDLIWSVIWSLIPPKHTDWWHEREECITEAWELSVIVLYSLGLFWCVPVRSGPVRRAKHFNRGQHGGTNVVSDCLWCRRQRRWTGARRGASRTRAFAFGDHLQITQMHSTVNTYSTR